LVEWTRGNVNWVGELLVRSKRRVGRMLTTMGVERVQVGNIGFDPSKVSVGISAVSQRLACSADASAVRDARRANFRYLQERLPGRVHVARELTAGACPLFLPILVRQKRDIADSLYARGVTAIEFWNYGDQAAKRFDAVDAEYLRDHLLGLPIHQQLSETQLDYIANQMQDLQALL
ncbi:MAG: hypothetical protein ABR565_03045, partial [Gammaproteobacteria bacterium]